MDNLERGPGQPFPALDATEDGDDLGSRYRRAAGRRDRVLSGLQDADLLPEVTATPRSGVERCFPLGVVMPQLCAHATHHRAPALNVLRHAGADVPSLDVAVWQRAGAPPVLPHRGPGTE